jgi:putative peptidoglycan lipid II flippase
VRPTLRFPAGVARRARGLAAYGIAALVTQDASLLVVTRLANGSSAQGAIVLYNYGWQVFFSICAVLAIPIAVSAFPALSTREGAEFDEMAAGSTRAVLMVSCLGAALLAAIAGPAARVFTAHSDVINAHGQTVELALGFAAFAPGLIGFGLMASLSRVLLAAGRSTVAAAAVSGGWLVVIGADVVLVHVAPARWVVAALGLGNTIGMTAAGVGLVVAVRRVRSGAALAAMARAAAAGVTAAVAGAAAGAAVAYALPASTFIVDCAAAALAAAAAAAVFAAVALLLDGDELKVALARVWRTVAR